MTKWLPSPTLPWYRWRIANHTTAVCCYWCRSSRRRLLGNLCRASHRWEFPGIEPPSVGSPLPQSSWHNTRTQGSPSPPSGEFVPSVTPLGIPWNWVAIRLDQHCPIPPGITPGSKDRLRRCPPWNPLDLDDSPPGSTLPHLSGIIPGPQDSTFLTTSSGRYIHTTRYAVCVSC